MKKKMIIIIKLNYIYKEEADNKSIKSYKSNKSNKSTQSNKSKFKKRITQPEPKITDKKMENRDTDKDYIYTKKTDNNTVVNFILKII